MKYGIIKSLLSNDYKEFDDTVLIESRFKEITRDGRYLRSVQLGLASKTFVIASEERIPNLYETNGSYPLDDSNLLDIVSLYPWESLKLTIFKRSKRKALKASYVNNTVRYFELANMPKRKIFWSLWHTLVLELNSSMKMWPFPCINHANQISAQSQIDPQLRFIKVCREKKSQRRWTDKYLYLGTNRENEDNARPVPVPGLGTAEDLKLLCLKPRYFGCWEQSEHWVQCGNCSSESIDSN